MAKLPTPQELIASRPEFPSEPWLDIKPQFAPGSFCYPAKKETMELLHMPNPHDWDPAAEDWNLPENWEQILCDAFEERLQKHRSLKLMLSGANLLLLDEPTNHLDISSREALEAALEDYEGTMLIITHDRYLVNRMADRILYMEEDGLTEYIGGYDDYLEAAARRPQPSAEAAPPKAEKPNSYKAQKERQSILNRAAGAVRRAEERIAAAEQELEEINQKLASPVVASDYVKSAELAKKADDKQAEIDSLYSQWEQAQQALDQLREEYGE